ncbi:S-layer homology domain-containing protein [Paenibacillus humicola]|uniref:S-layer homology domain-containing protein n=1 Tax=Paenibacillus humicola TaxID=3110540 RepID=UPI00237BA853|nr:S-layer homology domain-containing protein [Paenibacillus humicola]
MIAKALKLDASASGLTGFADDADIPAWAKGAVHAVKDRALIAGRGDGLFAPGDAVTRAEAVTVLVKFPAAA